MSAVFRLAEHGDLAEQVAWPLFVRDEFPQYEAFWRLFIVELTGRVERPPHINFRSKQALEAAGREEWHVEVAQLHYTTLLHLTRVCELRKKSVNDRDSFFEAIVRLDAATDTAFELLGHCLIDQGKSKSWDEKQGQKVREGWARTEAPGVFKDLHNYRNSLLHGRARSEHHAEIPIDQGPPVVVPLYPRLNTMQTTLDWREADAADTTPASQIVDDAWNEVLAYFRETWADPLIPWAEKHFAEPKLSRKWPWPFQSVRLDAISARSLSADAPPASSGGSLSTSLSNTSTRVHLDPPDDRAV